MVVDAEDDYGQQAGQMGGLSGPSSSQHQSNQAIHQLSQRGGSGAAIGGINGTGASLSPHEPMMDSTSQKKQGGAGFLLPKINDDDGPLVQSHTIEGHKFNQML